jgi:hypothetical protein
MPLEAAIKEHTGNTAARRSLIIGGKRINLSLNTRIPWASYDKITSERPLRFAAGNTLPLTAGTERFYEYVPLPSALSVSDAERILREGLLAALREEIGNGVIVSAEFETSEEGGVVTVTLRAECIEQIAASRGFTGAELAETGG